MSRQAWKIGFIVIFTPEKVIRLKKLHLLTYNKELIRKFTAFRYNVSKSDVFLRGLIEGTFDGINFKPNPIKKTEIKQNYTSKSPPPTADNH